MQTVSQAFGRLDGLRLIHLQCATGEDTLSWSALGLDSIGVDISEEQIFLAQRKAKEAGFKTRFLAEDIYNLPACLPNEWYGQGFDVVFTGGGALVWLPDLAEWAKIIFTLLKPGGRLILKEEHPIRSCLWVENGQIKVVDDYFRRTNPIEDKGWYHFQGGEDAQEVKYEFAWPIGDVVTALARTGLVIESLEEIPGGPEWRLQYDQGFMGRLPGQYILMARKEHEK